MLAWVAAAGQLPIDISNLEKRGCSEKEKNENLGNLVQ